MVPGPLQEENLPEMGGNPGPYPCPCPQGPAASLENAYCLCALGCLRGLLSNHFFPGGTAKGSRGAEAGVEPNFPRASSSTGAARVGRAAGARGARRQVPPAAAPSAARPSSPVARPPSDPFPASCRGRARPRPRTGAGPGWRLTLASASFCLGLRSPTLPLIVARARGAAVAAADGARARSLPPE